MIIPRKKMLTFSKILGFTLLMQFEAVNPVAARWFDEKYSHQSKPISAEGLKNLALKSPRTTFESLLDPILIPRVPGTPNHQKVKEFIVNHMSNLAWNVETDAFSDNTPHGLKPFENIIATLNPNVPRRLVLACHYDSKYTREYDFVGATDSAVPCAMLLHLATALQSELNDHKNRPHQNVTLQFIFFDGEEAFVEWNNYDSIYGARHLAQKWEAMPYQLGNSRENTNYLHRMDMLVLLDLLGTSKPKFYNFFDSTQHWHKLMVDIEQALKTNRLWSGTSTTTHFQDRRSYGGIEDDHIPFVQRGVDILHVIPSPFPKVWHTAKDNRSALDFTTIDNLNKIIRTFVASYLHLGDSS